MPKLPDTQDAAVQAISNFLKSQDNPSEDDDENE